MGILEKLFTEWEMKVISTVKSAVLTGMKNTGPEAKQIIEEYMVKRSIAEYYDEYSDPTYDRQYSLFDAFDVEAKFEGYDFIYSITPNPDKMPPHFSKSKYHRTGGTWISRNGYDVLKEVKGGPDKWVASSSFTYDEDNGTPDNAWIVHNLIEGVHPYTNTVKTSDGESEYEYAPIRGIPLYDRFDAHKPETEKQIAMRMIYNIKQECKKYF